MKFLTPIYLSLMNAFKDRALDILDKPEVNDLYPIALMQEYTTLRLDGGRQSGKSEALVEFAADWIREGNQVVFIGSTHIFFKEFKTRLERLYEFRSKNNPYFYAKAPPLKELKNHLFGTTIRKFLAAGDDSQFRGRKLNRILYIIDEPMRMPEMYKFYEEHHKGSASTACFTNGKKIPFFFVVGIQ